VCGKCASIAMPELAPRIVEKGLASDAVVIQTYPSDQPRLVSSGSPAGRGEVSQVG
jgi:hypothetical protein